MKHVFIAIGGSGTKVAEALIKLLAVGFPVRTDSSGKLTSVGDTLEIWRVDPDRSSGAVADLNDTLRQYKLLQNSLSNTDENFTIAGSRWAMEIETTVKDLNPLDLPKVNSKDNQIKTLGGILNSRYVKELEDSLPLLRPFYEEKDLEVPIDEGFYQKPFIGSAVMAIFAQSLKQSAASTDKDRAWIQAFDNSRTNFFLCGSLHGGTGASGVPVMAQFLKKRKEERNPDWHIGGCLLTPYFRPPNPPFERREGEIITKENLAAKTEEYFRQHRRHPVFEGADDDRIKKIIRLILQDYYAKPDEIVPRAKQGLDYYRQYASEFFDEMYLIGKPSPNLLVNWSNGGILQRNPLNSTEVVAAISALNFFANNRLGDDSNFVMASSSSEIDSERMRIADLPSYQVGRNIEPEKVFLATALLYFLVTYHLPWKKKYEAADEYKLFAHYRDNLQMAAADQPRYEQSMKLIRAFLISLLHPHQSNNPTGWSEDDDREIRDFFEQRDEKRFLFGSREILPMILGNSTVNKKIFADFPSWVPGGNFTRGEYLRTVWEHIFANCQTRREV